MTKALTDFIYLAMLLEYVVLKMEWTTESTANEYIK